MNSINLKRTLIGIILATLGFSAWALAGGSGDPHAQKCANPAICQM